MQLLKRVMIATVRGYQLLLSPFLPARCCFYPSCSDYMKQAITVHGVAKGLYLGLRRLVRCHPYSQGGVDEVPTSSSERSTINQ